MLSIGFKLSPSPLKATDNEPCLTEPFVMASPCPVYDDAFGPAINEECRGGFDFTLLFEQSMLGILPAAIFLLAFPARFAYLARQEEKTLLGPTRRKKLVLFAPKLLPAVSPSRLAPVCVLC